MQDKHMVNLASEIGYKFTSQ